METDGVISEISNENFLESIGDSLDETLKKNEIVNEKKMMKPDL